MKSGRAAIKAAVGKMKGNPRVDGRRIGDDEMTRMSVNWTFDAERSGGGDVEGSKQPLKCAIFMTCCIHWRGARRRINER